MFNFSYTWRGGPTSFIVFGVLFVLISAVLLAASMNEYSQLQRYQTGKCTITAKQLLQQEVTQTQVQTINGHTTTTTITMQEYRPNFQFTVQTTDGQSFSAQGYDAFSSTTSDRTSQQAIVDQYTVGATYPCWYNPVNPSQAVLARPSNGAIFFRGGKSGVEDEVVE